MSLTPKDVEALAAAIIPEVSRRLQLGTSRSAVVVSYEFSEHATRPKASVHFPEDPAGVNRQVAVQVAQPLNIGDVVIVVLAPMPTGTQVGYVTGVVAPPQVIAARACCGSVFGGSLDLTGGSLAWNFNIGWSATNFMTGMSLVDDTFGQAFQIQTAGLYSSCATLKVQVSQPVDSPTVSMTAELRFGSTTVDQVALTVPSTVGASDAVGTVAYLKLAVERFPVAAGDLVAINLDGFTVAGGAATLTVSLEAEHSFMDLGWEGPRPQFAPNDCADAGEG